MERKQCIVCGAELFDTLLELKNMPDCAEGLSDKSTENFKESIDMGLCQCSRCGLVQLNCQPVSYYKDCVRASGISSTVNQMRYNEYTELIDKYNLKGKKIVEVGCGHGEFLKVLAKFPISPYGIENNKVAATEAKKYGYVECAWIGDNEFISAEAPFDAFVCHNFLEHQPDPNSFLSGIYRQSIHGAVTIL